MLCTYFPLVCELFAPKPPPTPYCVKDARSEETERCLCTAVDDFEVPELKRCLNHLLYRPEASRTQKELLSIVVLRSKADRFAFLEGFTKLWAVGSWRELDAVGNVVREYPEERNVQIDVEYKDRPDGMISRGILALLGEYNERVVGEQLLYARIVPVLGSSL